MSLSEEVYNSTLTTNLSHSNFTITRVRKEWEAPFVMSMIIFTLTILLGVPGNGAVIWVTGFKMKSKVHSVCFLNLAASDLMYCLCLPSLMVNISNLHSGNVENILSPFFTLIMSLNAFASMYMLCLISIYRCLTVTLPIWFQQHLKHAWVRATCFVVWVISVMSLFLFIFRLTSDTMLILVYFSCGLSIVIMITCYAVIGWTLHGDRFVKSRKPVRLIVTAVTAFVICWLPFSFCFLLLTFFQKNIPPGWFMFTQALVSFNSALNPLIYVFAGSDFRQVFKRSLFASLQLAFTEQELQGETPDGNPTSDTNV